VVFYTRNIYRARARARVSEIKSFAPSGRRVIKERRTVSHYHEDPLKSSGYRLNRVYSLLSGPLKFTVSSVVLVAVSAFRLAYVARALIKAGDLSLVITVRSGAAWRRMSPAKLAAKSTRERGSGEGCWKLESKGLLALTSSPVVLLQCRALPPSPPPPPPPACPPGRVLSSVR
jgi:hypothetical protein